jgi:hypothetical protein
MAEPARPYANALDRAAAVSIAALLLFLGTEVVLAFVLTPSKAVLAVAGPACHYGIIASLLTAAVVLVLRGGFAIAGLRRARGLPPSA